MVKKRTAQVILLVLTFAGVYSVVISKIFADQTISQTPSKISVPAKIGPTIIPAVCPYFKGYSDKITKTALTQYDQFYEHAFYNNRTPYNNYNGEAWCASFASWVYKKAGYGVKAEDNSRNLLEQFASNATQKGKTGVFTDPAYAAPGDLVVWKRNNDKHGHTAIVLENDCVSRIIKTVEGNAERRQIRIISYTYQGIITRYKNPAGTQGGFKLYGFGRWYE